MTTVLRSMTVLFGLSVVMAGAGTGPGLAQEATHPLFTAYPGSTLSRHEAREFDEYNLVTGLEDDSSPSGPTIEGKVSRFFYQSPRDRSMLEIYRNYEMAFRENGLEVLFECAEDDCGPGYAASAWNRYNGITAKSGSECRYFAGRLTAEDGEAYVAVMVGKRRHQVDVVEVKGMETGLVSVDAEALASDIDRTGRASVYGIYFDSGKSDIKPESKPALDEIASLMENRPDLRIFVVGHTDNEGGLEMNMNLSRDRAAAVVKMLIGDYGIDAARLESHGVGPLAPAAPNTSEDGRAKNRRVELVAR